MIEKLLNDRIGLSYESLGRRNVEAAISSEMSRLGVSDAKGYFELLSRSEKHFEELCRSMLVPETWFFRYAESFAFLARHAREHFAARDSHLHVLSIPCSTGEEPYSIAMTLLDAGVAHSRLHVDAADASGAALSAAMRASYGPNSFRGGIPEPMRRFFRPDGENYEVVKEVRDLVAFRKNSVFDHGFRLHAAPAAPYDIIFCRNMLIYFSAEKQAEALSILTGMLADGGLLFVGHAESAMVGGHGFISSKFPSSFSFIKQGSVENTQAPADCKNTAPSAGLPRRGIPETASRKPHQRLPSVRDADTAEQDDVTKEGGQILRKAAEMADKGMIADAEALCIGYIRNDKLNPLAYYVLGVAGLSAGRLDDAEKAFGRALYLDPDYYEALVQLALIKERQGDYENASRMRKRAERTAAPARR